MSERNLKKLTIASIFFLFILAIAVALFLIFSKDEEQGNDSRPQPLDIKVVKVGALSTNESKFDFFAQIKNPNSFFGAPKIKYSFRLKPGADESTLLKTGQSFLLPGQTKYIIETSVPVENRGLENISLTIKQTKWEYVSRYQALSLWVADKSYKLLKQGPHFAQISGTLINDSFFDFERVFIKGIFVGVNDEVVGVTQTVVDDIKSGKERDFKMFVDHKIPFIKEVKVEPDTNIFLNSDFLESYD